MINAIIKPNHPAVNLETSKEILGNYYADMEEQVYTNTYNTVAENKRRRERKDKSPNVMGGGSLMKAADYNFNYGTNSDVQKCLNTEEDTAYKTTKGCDYQKKGGKM